MAHIRMIGKKGSQACKDIMEGTDIKRYTDRAISPVDVIINYGLHGDRLHNFFCEKPLAKKLPIINRYIPGSKLNAVEKAKSNGILVPDSKLSLSRGDNIADWIEKRHNSSRGFGIQQAHRREQIAGKYYQKFVRDRVYELRIAAFLWTPKTSWGVFKRHGEPDKIAWNFHQGGFFSRVYQPDSFHKALDLSEKILKLFKMGFGAVDFIVNRNREIFFIEVNSAPGFTDFSKEVYLRAFRALKELPGKTASKYGEL
jgi:hypothetical protein